MARPVLSALLLLLVSLPTPARTASVTSTWLGGTGAWTDANWSNGVPQNTATDSFDAQVDGGSATSSVVTIGADTAIESLWVDAGDRVVVTPAARLTITGPAIHDAGEIVLQGDPNGSPYDPNPPGLHIGSPSLELDGGGAIRLENAVLISSDPVALINHDNVISGWGLIDSTSGAGQMSFTNEGVVDANVAGKTLSLPTLFDVTHNRGVLRASNGGILATMTGSIDNAGGTIEATDGGVFSFSDLASISGGTMIAHRGSNVVMGAHVGGGIHLSTDATSSIGIGGDGGLGEATFESGNFQVDTYLNGPVITNYATIHGGFTPTGSVTIDNHGQIFLGVPPHLYSSPGSMTFTGGGAVTLQPDFDQDELVPIINLDNRIEGVSSLLLAENDGAVEASGGLLRVSVTGTHNGTFGAQPGAMLEAVSPVAGTGSWRADGGTIHLDADVTTTGNVLVLHGGALVVDTGLTAGDLVIDGTSSIDIEGMLRVAGNVDFEGPGSARFKFGPSGSVLANRGGGAAVGDWQGWQSFEVAGDDLGAGPAGFTAANAYLPDLVIGPEGRLVLRDHDDNGNRVAGAPEAIYVDTLQFSDSLGLLDLNGIKLYYNHLIGSVGQIIDVPVPEPGSAVLVMLALAGLYAARRARTTSRSGRPRYLRATGTSDTSCSSPRYSAVSISEKPASAIPF